MSKLISIVLAVVTALNMFGGFGAKADVAYPDYEAPGTTDNSTTDHSGTQGSTSDTPADAPAADYPIVSPDWDWDEMQERVDAFLKYPGVNGFICGGGNWPEGEVRLREMVYQLEDESVDYAMVEEVYASYGNEVHTDITYISATELDWLLWQITGVDLYDYDNGGVKDCWDLGGVTYLEEIDVYCVQHGDTNYQPMRAELRDYDSYNSIAYVRVYPGIEDMDLFCYVDGEFTLCEYIDLELWAWGEDMFEIRSIWAEKK